VLETATSRGQRELTRETLETLARQRQEPDWLLELRLAAFDTYRSRSLPTQQTEGWRRTSLSGLRVNDLNPLDAPTTKVQASDERVLVMDLAEASRDPELGELLQRQFAQLVPADFDIFTALHYAFFNSGALVRVPRGAAIHEPVWLTHRFEQPDQAAFVHTLVVLEDESELALVDDFASPTRGSTGLASVVVEQTLGRNAHLRYVHLQRWATDTWHFSTQKSQLAADAFLRTLNVSLGARTARNNVQVVLDGNGAQADLLGVASTDGRQHVDFETLQDHSGDRTRSDLFIHNALRGRSSANFTGLIRIEKTAHQTESAQTQKNVLLSARSRADSDPKLEILNNDVVRCTHGAAVGPVDEELVFYLQSRGLDRPSAERLIVEGFFQAVLEKLAHPDLQAAVWSAVAEKLALGNGQ
jgi:Fe-S cluster assembly protein SufD